MDLKHFFYKFLAAFGGAALDRQHALTRVRRRRARPPMETQTCKYSIQYKSNL
jgi:hypothetical protein